MCVLIGMKKKNITILGIVATLLMGCGQFRLYDPDRGEKVIQIGSHTLYEGAMEHLFTPGMNPKDSVATREKFVVDWVRTALKRDAAQAALAQYKTEIDTKVEDYRDALMTFQYENSYVDAHIDTLVTQTQVNDYYQQNKSTFRLVGPLVKARIACIPAGLRQSKKLEEMFKSKTEKDRSDFNNICSKNNYKLDNFTDQWTDFSSVLRYIPFSQKNFDEFLKAKSYYEVEDSEYKYMMQIEEYMLSGDFSPVEREQQNIRKILLHNRRGELIRHLDDSLMHAAGF